MTDTLKPCICDGASPLTDDGHAIRCPAHAHHQAWVDMIATPALRPCPFCGSPNPEMKRADAVWCGSCLAEMPEHDPDVPNAAARWNTRHPDGEREALIEALEGLLPHVEAARLREEAQAAAMEIHRMPVRSAVRKARTALSRNNSNG